MLNAPVAVEVFSALAHELRLEILRLLLVQVPDGMPAGRIRSTLACSGSTLTFHLHCLEEVGLVRSHRQATSIIYTAVPEALTGVVDFLMKDCCGGRPELCGSATTSETENCGGTGCR